MSRMRLYRRHYQDLAPILLAMMRHGIRVDIVEAKRQREALVARCVELRDQLVHLVGADRCTCRHLLKRHPPTKVNTTEGLLRKDGKPRAPKWKTIAPCVRCECKTFHPSHPPLHGKTDLAAPRVVHFLYTTLGFPKLRKRGEPGLTADEVALRKCLLRTRDFKPKPKSTKLWEREPTYAAECIDVILEFREYSKLADFVNPKNFDIDDRIRCFYKVTTENGRLASAKNPLRTGMNLQNLPRPGKNHPHTWIRKCFLPDEGHVWLGVDSSQIEDRIVKVLSKVASAIVQARLHPTEFDAHNVRAQEIFSRLLKCAPEEVDPDVEVTPGNTRRQIGKPVKHGSNYGEGPMRLQEQLLKEGVVLSIAECKQLLAAAFDETSAAYQKETRRRQLKHRFLVNSYGRYLDFHGCRIDDEAYRRGYAFRAASENGDHTNQDGLIPLWYYIVDNRMDSRILTQTHDSIEASCPVSEVYDVAKFLQEKMEAPRLYEGVELSIPVGFKIGVNWMCVPGQEWKVLPPREELERVARALLKDEQNRRAA